jgi:uncharacterized repeat protein (TIGR04052 family)
MIRLTPRAGLALAVAASAVSACQATVPGPTQPVPQTADMAAPTAAPAAVPADTVAVPAAPAVQAPAAIAVQGQVTFRNEAVSGYDLAVYDAVTGQALTPLAPGAQAAPGPIQVSLAAPRTGPDGRFALTAYNLKPGTALRVVATPPTRTASFQALVVPVAAPAAWRLAHFGVDDEGATVAAIPAPVSPVPMALTITEATTVLTQLARGPLAALKLLAPEAAAPTLNKLHAESLKLADALQAAMATNPHMANYAVTADSDDAVSAAESASIKGLLISANVYAQAATLVAQTLSDVAAAAKTATNLAPGADAAILADLPLVGTSLAATIDAKAGTFKLSNAITGAVLDLAKASAAEVGQAAAATSKAGSGGSSGPSSASSPVELDGDVTIRFKGVVGDQPFLSGVSFGDLGTKKNSATAVDFRFYVHKIRLVRTDDVEVPVTLKSNSWQLPNGSATGTDPARGLALLDFDTTATMGTNDRVEGTVPAGTYKAVKFVLGLPNAENHGDQAAASGPLGPGVSGMFWSWQSGYKLVKIDLNVTRSMGMGYHTLMDMGSPSGANFSIHLGATGCSGNTLDGYTCTSPNTPEVTIAGFDPTQDAVAADLKALVSGSDLSAGNGCHSASDDAECPPLLQNFGTVAASGQTFFRRAKI